MSPRSISPPHTVPVAPGRLPLLGHTLGLLRRRFAFTSSLSAHGELVKLYLGPLATYVVTTPALVQQVLVTEGAHFEKGIMFDRFRPFFGNGIAMSNGAVHRRQRRLVQPAFHHERIAGYTATMARVAQDMTASWKPHQVIEFDLAMQELAVTIVGKTLFATEIGETVVREAQRSMPIVIKQGMIRALSPAFLATLPIPGNRRFDQAIERLHAVVRDVITAGRGEQADRGDVLSMLLAARDADTGAGMTDQQVHDEVVTLLTGGIETTALILGWFFHELAKNPQVEQRFHAELDDVLDGRPVTAADLPRLTYTRRIVSEVLRRYPLWLLMRRAKDEVELGGVRFPPGTEITFSPHALHHDPRHFPDPQRFDPDRWTPEKIAELPKGAYVPFGAGSRQCIGNEFAHTEIAVAAATIGTRWRMVAVPGKKVRIKVSGAGYPSQLPMTAVPRIP